MTTVLLAVLLTFISYKLLTRGYITWHTESLHAKQAKLEEAREPLLSDRQNSDDDGASGLLPTPACKPVTLLHMQQCVSLLMHRNIA